MGQSTSKYNHEQSDASKVDNIKRLFSVNEQNDMMDSLNLDLNTPFNKIPLPYLEGGSAPQNMEGGGESNRYAKHDIFNLITSLEESHNQQGGDYSANALDNNSTSDAGMQHIKEAVLKELNGQNGAGNASESGCGCDNGNCESQAGGKKKKSKKSRKVIENTSDANLNTSSDDNDDKQKNFSIYPYNSSDAASSNASERNFRMMRRKI